MSRTLNKKAPIYLEALNEKSSFWHKRNDYPMIDRGDYIMHPRNFSQNHDFDDPIKVYIMSAEAECRRGMSKNKKLPVINSFIEFNYIENKKLQMQYKVRKKSKLSDDV
jgi:hypothetical protein